MERLGGSRTPRITPKDLPVPSRGHTLGALEAYADALDSLAWSLPRHLHQQMELRRALLSSPTSSPLTSALPALRDPVDRCSCARSQHCMFRSLRAAIGAAGPLSDDWALVEIQPTTKPPSIDGGSTSPQNRCLVKGTWRSHHARWHNSVS